MENSCYSKDDVISPKTSSYADTSSNCITTHQRQDTPGNKIQQLFLKGITIDPECDPSSPLMSVDAQPVNK
jgi:hypothetical protein